MFLNSHFALVLNFMYQTHFYFIEIQANKHIPNMYLKNHYLCF